MNETEYDEQYITMEVLGLDLSLEEGGASLFEKGVNDALYLDLIVSDFLPINWIIVEFPVSQDWLLLLPRHLGKCDGNGVSIFSSRKYTSLIPLLAHFKM